MLVKKLRIGFILLLAIMIVATPTLFLVQGQIPQSYQQDIIEIADKAEQKIMSLFEWIDSQSIEDLELQLSISSYEPLFEEGKLLLQNAKSTIQTEGFEAAAEDIFEALRIFREVLKSVNILLEEAGINPKGLVDKQGFYEVIVRAKARIAYLRVLFEGNSEVETLLNEAEENLVIAEELFEDNLTEAAYYLREANQLISQVHELLKEEAILSNEWRIFDYCERIRERTRNRFRYGSDQGVNIDAFLGSLGYQNENQFMEMLEGLIQNAENNPENFNDALEVLETIGNMIRQMEGQLTQEINQHQNHYGSGGTIGGNFGGQNSGGP